MGVGGLAELIQRIHQRLELVGQLGEHVAEHFAAASRERLAQRAVSAATHGNVVVDVDELARKAACKESGNKQGHIPEPLQAAIAVTLGGSLEGIRQHESQRFQAHAVRSSLIESLGTRKQGEQIDDVVLCLIVDRELLLLQRPLQ